MNDGQIPLSEELGRPISLGVIEEETYLRGFRCLAGLDEVGRGPLAGPVVAAAVVLPRGFSHPDIRDSKLLSSGQREKLVPIIKQTAVTWGLGVVEVEEVEPRVVAVAVNASIGIELWRLRIFASCRYSRSLSSGISWIGQVLPSAPSRSPLKSAQRGQYQPS